jgi:phosphatidylglycerol:prolipoprotein diacylglycerol transferase
MLPELFKLPALGITVYTYGLMLALGCAGGLYIAVRFAESNGVSREHIYHLAFWVLPVSLFGTKLLAIAQLLQDAFLGKGFPSALEILETPGFYLGGLLAGLVSSTLLIKAWKLSWLKTADAVAPSLAIGNVLGRIGCFAAGCCWGKPTTTWIGVSFDQRAHEISGVPIGLALVPTQLIEAAASLVIFLLLMRRWKRRVFHGQVVLSFMLLYPVERFVVEFWRDDPRGQIMNLSTSQFLCLHTFAAAAVLYWWLRRRSSERVRRKTTGSETQPVLLIRD